MKKVNRPKMRRIMVAMPPAMYADFKEKADQSGLSMSRIIYLRLRNRGSMVVPDEVHRMVEHIVSIFDKIVAEGVLCDTDREYLRRIVDFESALVDVEDKPSIVHGRQVKKRG